MNTPLTNSLLITAIGMGLVFLAILLLWGMMELTVKLTAKSALQEESETEEGEEETPAAGPASDLKRRAAAAAVAVALATRRSTAGAASHEQAPTVSSWQAVMRADQLNQRANLFSRKSRGTER